MRELAGSFLAAGVAAGTIRYTNFVVETAAAWSEPEIVVCTATPDCACMVNAVRERRQKSEDTLLMTDMEHFSFEWLDTS
ncbi:MAG: hypothetical protein DMG97_06550 [Acidobacteria bacterium]|nr:MAG: hypothetical protein DMG98_09225 [Acidobacteriota bacterium]PYV75363.1 MAG: hypothetical protein DMG97_06550 [Acidobacteriota bacterium]